MTDYLRQRDWFDPSKVTASATIVGCGGIGSFAAFALAKLGVQQINLVDFDQVDEHNIPNQLYPTAAIGVDKVAGLADTLWSFAGTNAVQYMNMLEAGFPMADVVVSALDSMAARRSLWERVKYKVPVKLFLDGRLGGEHIVLYAVNPISPGDIAGYEATLHSDAEGMDLPCTGRSIIDVGFAIGSLITRAVRKHYAGEELPKLTYLNQSTLNIFKGGWQ